MRPKRRERRVRERRQKLALPVVVEPLRLGRVEHRLLLGVRLLHYQIEDRSSERLDRREILLRLRTRRRVASDDSDDGLAVPLLRDERRRWGEPHGRRQRQLAPDLARDISVPRQDLRRLFGGPGDEPARDGGA